MYNVFCAYDLIFLNVFQNGYNCCAGYIRHFMSFHQGIDVFNPRIFIGFPDIYSINPRIFEFNPRVFRLDPAIVVLFTPMTSASFSLLLNPLASRSSLSLSCRFPGKYSPIGNYPFCSIIHKSSYHIRCKSTSKYENEGRSDSKKCNFLQNQKPDHFHTNN